MFGFNSLQGRLLQHLLHRIRNGEFTERALALKSGISQPHMHNVLKGVRALNPGIGDQLLAGLGITIVDLLETGELRRALYFRTRGSEHSLEVPVLKDRLGPGLPWPEQLSQFERVQVPVRSLSRIERPVVARLSEDPAMLPLLNAGDLVLLDRAEQGGPPGDPDALFAVRRGGQTILRWLRPGRGRHYLVSAMCRERPRDWEPVEERRAELVLARAIPLRWMHPPELLYDPLLQHRDTRREPAPPSAAS
jgi:hypothetical protein